MYCACGFTIPHFKAPPDNGCMSCGKQLKLDADDFLLHGAEGLVKNSRIGQVTMARAVEKALADRSALLVEGPVGVGKSFAYLLPALLSGKRVVVSTAKKPLQVQLALSDGPRLVEAVNGHVPGTSIAMLKGKSNYGCLVLAGVTGDVPGYAEWLKKSETADLSEYVGARPAKMFDVTAEGCVGKKCPQADACGYMKTRKRAMDAKILVVNHSLVAFDLRFGPMKLFGPYEALIVDEAHNAPSSFRGAFEESISNRGLSRIVKRMDALEHIDLPADGKEISQLWNEAFHRASHLTGTIKPAPFGSVGTELRDLLDGLRAFLDKHTGILNRRDVENMEEYGDDSGVEQEDFQPMTLLSRVLHRTIGALDLLEDPTVNTLLTAEKNAGTHRFKATPVSVGALVGDKLALIPTTVFTSATMTTNGSFSDFSRQLGLRRLADPAAAPEGSNLVAEKKEITELAVPSPFDYKKQGAFLYIPKTVKTPVSEGADPAEREEYLDSIAQEVLALVHASSGQALVLFTATSDMRGVHERLEAAAPNIPWLTQDADTGQGAEAVMQLFHNTPGGVILGLKSFWEGVSIEGDKLWLVIVTKLPFPSPADPLQQAQAERLQKELTAQGVPLKEQGYAVFRQLSIPPMLTDIRQGAGRLVRTTTDRGVMAILDTRVWSGKTGVAPELDQKSPRGYGVTVIKALGFAGNWTDDFTYVAAKFRQWKRPAVPAPVSVAPKPGL